MKTSLIVLLIVCIVCSSKTEVDAESASIPLPTGPSQDATKKPDPVNDMYGRGCSKLNQCRGDDTTN